MPKEKNEPVSKAKAKNTDQRSYAILAAGLSIVLGVIIFLFVARQRNNAPAAPAVITVAALPDRAVRLDPPTFTPTSTDTPAPTLIIFPSPLPYTPLPPVVSQPPISGANGLIAYVSGRNLYTVDVATGQTQILIANASDPLWSPDGAWIAYNRYFGATDSVELMVAHADGSEERQLSQGGLYNFSYRWLPNSQGVVFINKVLVNNEGRYTARPKFHLARLDGRPPQEIISTLEPEGHKDYEVSPDSQSIVYIDTLNNALMRIKLASNTQGVLAITTANTYFGDYAWSPDGTTIAYSTFGAFASNIPSELYSIPATGGVPMSFDVTRKSTFMEVFGWSPDSRFVYASDNQVFATDQTSPEYRSVWNITFSDEEEGTFEPRVASNGAIFWVRGSCIYDGHPLISFYTANLGGEPLKIASAGDRAACIGTTAGRSFWDVSPDGAYVAYVVQDDTGSESGLHIVSADGTRHSHILAGAKLYAPVWQPAP